MAISSLDPRLSWSALWRFRGVVSLAVLLACGFAANVSAQQGVSKSVTPLATGQQLPTAKQTTLGLYVTAKQAFDMWQAFPGRVTVVDVRTPEEYALIGHAEMAWNIPLGFITYERKGGEFQHGVRMNGDFVAEVAKLAQPTDILLLMCRSGSRSAMAVNLLAAAGFENAYNITDGMEGDKVKDPDSVYLGKRMKNGWKNSGLPWAYSFDPEKILIEEGASKNTAPAE